MRRRWGQSRNGNEIWVLSQKYCYLQSINPYIKKCMSLGGVLYDEQVDNERRRGTYITAG